MTECIECSAPLPIQNPTQGEIIDCPDCGLELEIRTLQPLTLQPAPQTAEDWGE